MREDELWLLAMRKDASLSAPHLSSSSSLATMVFVVVVIVG